MATGLQGKTRLNGVLTHRVLRRADLDAARRRKIRRWKRWNWMAVRWREIPTSILLLFLPLLRWFVPSLCVIRSELRLKVLRGDGTVEDYGTVGRHLITTAGKKYVASTFANTAEPEVFKYHGYGTGTGAAAVGDTALGTELTTQYASDNTRPTGSQASDGTVVTYTTIATLSPDSGGTIAVTEWGLFSQAANSGGTLLDRQVFSAVNLVAGSDSLQTTYVLTIS